MSNDNGSEPKLILKAELINDKIIVDIYSKHIPTLAYIESLIQAEKIKLIICEKAKEEAINSPKVISPNTNPLGDFLKKIRR